MDNLYSDLENYDEVYIVDELRNENKELKLKLEEYKTAIGKLQKDYDKLVLEFNNLQTNYSSLLKTARAEVERKAHTISQLNIEKDMMILKTLQNRNNRFRNSIQRSNQITNKASDEASKVSDGKKGKNKQINKKSVDKTERCISSNTSVPTTEKSENIKLNILDKVVDKVDECINQGELKENVAQCKPPHKDSPKACGIKSRRKTMPAVSISHLSSDEDSNAHKITDPTHNKAPPTANSALFMSKRIPKLSERLGSKTSETTSASEKSSNYQEPTKEDYKSRTTKHLDSDKYRDNDRFRAPKRCSDETDKLRDSDKYREDDKFRVSNRDRKSDNIRQDEPIRDKYRQGNKLRESDRGGESSKLRDRFKSRDIGKCKDVLRFREQEKFRANEEFHDGGKSRHSDKYRMEDKNRDSGDKYTDFARYRDGDKNRESDQYGMRDKYRDCDRFNEGDKYRDIDKLRIRTKFDPSHRQRRHYSPDRPYKRNIKEIQDDHKLDYRRHRVLESPPPELHSVYQQRSQNTHLHHEITRDKSDLYVHRQDLPITESHSFPDPDEPFRKRRKVEHEIPIDDRRNHLRPSYLKECEMLVATCQSPDAVFSPDPYSESTIAHTVKEIKSTAIMPLEDPRVTSIKYVIQIENGTDTLSTAASKCINIKPVDKSLWNIKRIAMPDALLQRSQTRLEEIDIKQIYMDIENLEGNVSMESGEILEDNVCEYVNKDINTRNNIQGYNKDDIVTDEIFTQNNNKELQNVQKYNTMQKISKVMSDSESNNKNQITIVPKVSDIVSNDNITDENVVSDNRTTTSQTNLPQIDDQIESVPIKLSNVNPQENRIEKPILISLSEIAMVQDDLHLSDENSDNIDHKQVAAGVEQLYGKISVEANIIDLGSDTKYDFEIKVDTVDDVNISNDNKSKESKGHKKHKNKRVKKNEGSKVSEKNSKSKKDRESKPKQMKNKFTDLFGDSNSLITPEDLGIPATCVPLCEDAQDAVDIDLKDITNPPLACLPPITENVQQEIQVRKEISQVSTATVADRLVEGSDVHIVNPDVERNIPIFPNVDIGLNKLDVKAVIISTGVQPQFILDSESAHMVKVTENTNANTQNIFDINLLPAGMKHKKQVSLRALATSTPHKELPTVETIEKPGTTDGINVSIDNKNESLDTKESGTDHSNTNSHDTNDVPDVRIFVRRRRKVVKKT